MYEESSKLLPASAEAMTVAMAMAFANHKHKGQYASDVHSSKLPSTRGPTSASFEKHQ
jgi:hypothetical protein